MKNFILISLLLALTIILITCSKNNPVSPTYPAVNNISGTLSGWTHGNNVYLVGKIYDYVDSIYIVLDSVLIGSDGSFNLPLITPSDNYLRPIIISTHCSGTINVIPSSTKSAALNILELHLNGIQKGSVNYNNIDSTIQTGSFIGFYEYFNQNASITGGGKCIYPPDTTAFMYNYTVQKGWNKLIDLLVRNSNSYDSAIIQNNEPQGGKWYFSWYGN